MIEIESSESGGRAAAKQLFYVRSMIPPNWAGRVGSESSLSWYGLSTHTILPTYLLVGNRKT